MKLCESKDLESFEVKTEEERQLFDLLKETGKLFNRFVHDSNNFLALLSYRIEKIERETCNPNEQPKEKE